MINEIENKTHQQEPKQGPSNTAKVDPSHGNPNQSSGPKDISKKNPSQDSTPKHEDQPLKKAV